jgi:hypothetical protein
MPILFIIVQNLKNKYIVLRLETKLETYPHTFRTM